MHQKLKNKSPINLMIKIPLKNSQYFIHVTNIFYKLLDALAYSRFTLVSKITIIMNSNLIFVCCIFQIRKEKRKAKISSIILYLLNYIFTCCFNNLHSTIIHSNLTFFHWNQPLNPHHFEIFILVILDNIILCSSHPHMSKDRIMWLHDNKISIVYIFK
jgi:hypothetical protein